MRDIWGWWAPGYATAAGYIHHHGKTRGPREKVVVVLNETLQCKKAYRMSSCRRGISILVFKDIFRAEVRFFYSVTAVYWERDGGKQRGGE